MSLFYCTFCDSYCDSNEQDHADYSGDEIKCQDCVDKESEASATTPTDVSFFCHLRYFLLGVRDKGRIFSLKDTDTRTGFSRKGLTTFQLFQRSTGGRI